ncbi:hypothetical protein CIWKM_02_03220 [Citrobacter werkmanii NBRC 105721]|nr:hypothetical protein CIWKM_02_03220 [Citrobacter werkmanii NBRC 105721]
MQPLLKVGTVMPTSPSGDGLPWINQPPLHRMMQRDLMGLVDRLVSLLVTSTANDSQLQTLFNYLLRYGNVSHVSAFIHEVAERSPHHKERLMTIAERLRQEGHHHGLQEGIQQGLEQGVQKGTQEEALRIARMMLENGIDHNLVQLITGLLPGDVTE